MKTRTERNIYQNFEHILIVLVYTNEITITYQKIVRKWSGLNKPPTSLQGVVKEFFKKIQQTDMNALYSPSSKTCEKMKK